MTVADTELEEATADMFLNWVYRTLGLGGFENTNWPAIGDPPDSTMPGDIYFEKVDDILDTIFSNQGW